MSVSSFLILKAIVSLIFGLASLLLPEGSAAWFGLAINAAGTLMTRLFGAVLLGIGLICWFTSQATDTRLGQDVILSLFVADTIGFVVALLGQLSLQAGLTGWVGVFIWLVLALGLGYFRFMK